MDTNKQFFGVVPPIITPVDEHENVDPVGLRRVIDYVLDGGVHGIFVNGSNGEFYGLDYENQKRATEIAVEHVNGSVPVYAGASAITTKESIRLARMAEAAGASALTVLTPMFVQPTEDELYDHFVAIAEATSLPVILYNNPGRTTNNVSVGVLERLLKIERIVGVKNTSMDFSLTMKYLRAGEGRPDFGVFGGIDYYVYATLSHGGVGCVAGTANVAPGLVVSIYDHFNAGNHAAAIKDQQTLMSLRDAYAWGTFPVMMKVCLNLLGVDVGMPIRPVQYVDAGVEEKAKEMLRKIGLL
ncbi:MAG: dihydrodipicolinate synthase family protein [Alkalispirochaeta sp.]